MLHWFGLQTWLLRRHVETLHKKVLYMQVLGKVSKALDIISPFTLVCISKEFLFSPMEGEKVSQTN